MSLCVPGFRAWSYGHAGARDTYSLAKYRRVDAPRYGRDSTVVKVIDIRVLREAHKIALVVEMPLSRYHTAQAPHVPRRLLRLFPRMARHTCHNGLGKTFRQEARHTEIPHLFEHLLVELQLHAQHADDLTLRGVTEWNWQRDPHGHFHVLVDYENELLAVGAIQLAERIMAYIDLGELEAIDMDHELELLQNIARLGRAVTGVRARSRADSSRSTRRNMLRAVVPAAVMTLTASAAPIAVNFASAKSRRIVPAVRSARKQPSRKSFAKPPRIAVVVAHQASVATLAATTLTTLLDDATEAIAVSGVL